MERFRDRRDAGSTRRHDEMISRPRRASQALSPINLIDKIGPVIDSLLRGHAAIVSCHVYARTYVC